MGPSWRASPLLRLHGPALDGFTDPALSAPHGSGSPAATDPSPASALSRPPYAPFPAHPSPSSTEPSRTCVPLAEGPVYAGSSPLQPSLFPGGARGSWRGRDYLYLPLVLGGFPPPPSSPRDGPRGWGLRGKHSPRVLSRRVMSSQFPALCKLHPPLVVEQAKELLEFVGGPRSGGHVLTSVVRQPLPRPSLHLTCGPVTGLKCCPPPRCGPSASIKMNTDIFVCS